MKCTWTSTKAYSQQFFHHVESKVKAELGDLVSKGVIAPLTEPTQWVSQLVVERLISLANVAVAVAAVVSVSCPGSFLGDFLKSTRGCREER